MHILFFESDRPLPLCVFQRESIETLLYFVQMCVTQQPRVCQHSGVGPGCRHVIRHEAIVQQVIVARCERQDLAIQRFTLVPKSCHGR